MSDATQTTRWFGLSRQSIVIAGVFGGITLLLAIAYLLVLRPGFVVLAEDLRPTDSAAIVAVLEKRGTPYHLANGGTTILVPADQADATRVALVGSDVGQGGQVGFELFNKSDMGLTSFAQKINYQRALQGELVRTLMQIDGVATARVHLAMPEHALFRGDRAVPKAAVTLTMRPGNALTADRVLGVQRLVAAAVPELPESQVVVIDAEGRVVSTAPSIETADGFDARSPEAEERGAIASYYQARARQTIAARLPGLAAQVRALIFPRESAPGDEWSPAGDGDARNYALRFVVATSTALNAEDQSIVRDAMKAALALDFDRGDEISFQQGLVDPPVSPKPAELASSTPALRAAPAAASDQPELPLLPGYAWLALLLAPVLGVALWRVWRPRLSEAEQISFAERLNRQLNLTDTSDAAA